MANPLPDHYATLGLHRRCTNDQVRTAYRILAKQLHPDVNGGSDEAHERTRALNAAHETLSHPDRRAAYDRELARAERASTPSRTGRALKSITEDVHLRLEELLRGTTLTVRVNDPANPDGAESYEVEVAPMTPPGARLRVRRAGRFEGGVVVVRVKARPDMRFKPRGSDLRTDLRISTQRALQGGTETIQGVLGNPIHVVLPRGIGRGETIRIPGQGLPTSRGTRGDLLVRIQYRPEVRITRAARSW